MEIGRGLIAPLILALILILTLAGTLQASQFRVTQIYDGDTIKGERHDLVIL